MKAKFDCSYCDHLWSIIVNLKNEPVSPEEVNGPKSHTEDPTEYCETRGITPTNQIRRIIARFNRKMVLLNLIAVCKRNSLKTIFVYSKQSKVYESNTIDGIRELLKRKLRIRVLEINSNNLGQPDEMDEEISGYYASSKIGLTTRYVRPINKTAAIVF